MEIVAPLQNLFCQHFPCCSVSITGFRQGSTIAELVVAIARGALSDCDIAERLISQMNTLPATLNDTNVEPGRFSLGKSHRVKIKIDQNRKIHLQILDMWCKNVREKCRDSKKNFCTMSFFVNPG